MNTNDRIANINKKGEELKILNEMKKINKMVELNFLIKQAKTLAPRVTELLNVANALWKNNLPCGNVVTYSCCCKKAEFFTDGVNHNLGFVPVQGYSPYIIIKPVQKIGIEGGGCEGVDVNIDCNGDIDFSGEMVNQSTAIGKIKSLLDNFDAFEMKFYNYIDSIYK